MSRCASTVLPTLRRWVFNGRQMGGKHSTGFFGGREGWASAVCGLRSAVGPGLPCAGRRVPCGRSAGNGQTGRDRWLAVSSEGRPVTASVVVPRLRRLLSRRWAVVGGWAVACSLVRRPAVCRGGWSVVRWFIGVGESAVSGIAGSSRRRSAVGGWQTSAVSRRWSAVF